MKDQLKESKYYNFEEIKKPEINNINELNKFDISEKIQFQVINNKSKKRYFLKCKNFNIIKKYNNSNFYALTIGELANNFTNDSSCLRY